MTLRSLVRWAPRFLLPFAVCSTFYLYLYPIFHGCTFPCANGSLATNFNDAIRRHVPFNDNRADSTTPVTLAPFRLLVLADPQLEGDSSLPKADDAFIPRIQRRWTRLRIDPPTFDNPPTTLKAEIRDLLLLDIPETFQALRKRLDLFGNDYYLAHIYRTLHWWTKPSHVTVLGDLIGSQWVDDEEFDWRGWRYWNRVFAGGKRVDDEIMHTSGESSRSNLNETSWNNRIINIVGNHDIGYAGDISKKRMERFERLFGAPNWDIRFDLDSLEGETFPSLHLIVLNSMNLDTPALDEDLQGESYSWLNTIVSKRSRPVEDRSSFTLLLTHIPLHKEPGVCVDSPWFDYYGDDDGGGVYRPHGIKEQNHLSDHSSRKGILEVIFGMSGKEDAPAHGKGRNGLILTGHDHEGCDIWHHVPKNQTLLEDEEGDLKSNWQASRWKESDPSLSHTGVREVTLRSMMGEYGGNAGLLSAWFDVELGEWQYDIQMCSMGVQHIWWAVHVLDITAVMLTLVFGLTRKNPLPKAKAEELKINSKTSKGKRDDGTGKADSSKAKRKTSPPKRRR